MEIGINLTERIDLIAIPRISIALVGSGKRRSHHAVFDCRPWGQQDIVLIHTHHIRSFCTQYTNDLESYISDSNFFTYGGFFSEQLSYDCSPDYANFICITDVVFGERFTIFQVSPVPNVKECRSSAIQISRDVVAVAKYQLCPGTYYWGHTANGGALFNNCIRVLWRQRH